jgi:putative solute:sodium symporter small subunit
MGATLVILLGCFLAWCSVSIIRRGYFTGRNPEFLFRGNMRYSKRFYRAGHPIQFWAVACGGIVMAVVLIAYALSRLYRV